MIKKYKNYIEEPNILMHYKEYIERLANDGKDEVFYNSGPDHAATVMSAIFTNGSKYIKIYAGKLNGPVSTQQQYWDALESFLRKDGVSLKIILQKFDVTKKPKIFDLLRYYNLLDPAKVEVKTHNFRVARGLDGKEIHFTVSDDCMYRVENDVANFTAEGNFNDAERSGKLSKLFDKMFSSAKIVPVSL